MSKPIKIFLFVAGGFAGIFVCIAVFLLFFLDANTYRSQLETVLSESLEMEVRVGGQLGIAFFPGVLITLKDVHIGNQEADVVFAEEARAGIDLLSLLRKEVRIGKLLLKHPRILIERDRDGKFNFEKPEAASGTLPVLALSKVSISDGTLLYADKQSGEGFEAVNCRLKIDRLRLSGGNSDDLMKNLSFTAELGCGEIRNEDFTVSDLKVSVNGKNGTLDFQPVTMQVFGAQGTGSIQADFSGAAPRYEVQYSLSQFQIKEFFKTLSSQKVAEGSMDFSATLSMHGKSVNEMKQTVEGQISLWGENLRLYGRDLDEEFSRFESSQNFNLVDVGAFFFAGPLGLVVTKGYNFASIFQGSGGLSEIRTLVSDWKVERGVALAQDVAMLTNENRVALQGGLDFVNEQFHDVTIALIDAKGCVRVQQRIHGTFRKPVVDQPSFLRSLTGPVLNLYEKGRQFLPSGECEVFYSGSIVPKK